MNNVVRTQGVGRLILKVLAIGSALTFLAVVMVNACATYAAPTKAAPVVHPGPAGAPPRPAPPRAPEDNEYEMHAAPTKAGPVFRPRRLTPAAQEAQQQAPPPPQRQTGAGAP